MLHWPEYGAVVVHLDDRTVLNWACCSSADARGPLQCGGGTVCLLHRSLARKPYLPDKELSFVIIIIMLPNQAIGTVVCVAAARCCCNRLLQNPSCWLCTQSDGGLWLAVAESTNGLTDHAV
jgi:hypothetical protein